ncbi:MAG: PEGA domain-containing protein [Polyangiaceae bacterium]|nr:PEGA domain-containing protein [Polyangiaceae bacterium]
MVVSVDGAEACSDEEICLVKGIEKGSHKVKASAPGYADSATKLVTVEGGSEAVLNLELSKASDGTGLSVSSEIDGLTLIVDGKKVGGLPQKLTDLEPGKHDIEIKGGKYFKPYKKTLTVEEDKILEVSPEFELESAMVTISRGENTSGARMYLKGGSKSIPLHRQKLPIDITLDPAKDYRVVATRKGYEDFEEEIEFSVEKPETSLEISLIEVVEEEEEETTATATTKPKTPTRRTTTRTTTTTKTATTKPQAKGDSKLNINSIPMSRIVLDGRPLGSTPKFGVKVSPGSHTVIFIHPQLGRKTKTVNVGAGKTSTAAVRFK